MTVCCVGGELQTERPNRHAPEPFTAKVVLL